MSNSVLTLVFERSQSKGVARLVLLAIADRANDDGRAFPGTSDIAKRANCSRRAVISARQELVGIGELVVEKTGGSSDEGRSSSRYRIVLPPVQGLHPNPNKPKEPKKGIEIPSLPFASSEFKTTWEEFAKHRTEKRKPLTKTSVGLLFKKLQAMGEVLAIAALQASIENGWTGVFPPKSEITERPKYDPTGRPMNEAARRVVEEKRKGVRF